MEKQIKILLLEDSPDDAALIERALKREGMAFACERVDTEAEFVAALNGTNPDVVLSDHGLPQFNSIEALKILRSNGSNAPFILVTGTVSEDFAVSCLKQGADDYILKSNLSRLPASIQSSLSKHEISAKKKKAEAELVAQNIELVRSNDDLKKANSELDKFVYSISHNLRSPLASVLGLINIAKHENKNLQKEPDPYLGMIEGSVNKLDETLKEILAYSINARTALQFRNIDFRNLFLQYSESLKYLPGADQIAMTLTMDGQGDFSSDPIRVGMILNNLLSNAIKYSDVTKTERFVKMHVSIKEQATIVIEDNGVGIASDCIDKVFDMFFRGTNLSDGAGLGLYIAKEAVEKLSGKISITSIDGQGTTFTVLLPNNLTQSK